MRAPPYSDRPDALFSQDCINDPFPLYAELRDDRPISRVGETGVHLVASWDLIEEALGREDDFSAHLTGVLMRGDDGQPTTFALPQNAATQVIATANEPRHAVHRVLVKPRLAQKQVPALEAPLRRWTRAAIGDWLAAGAGDFVPVAERIPAHVVAHLLGLPDDDVPRLRKWAMMGGDILAGEVNEERLGRLAVETLQMGEYLGAHFDETLADPRDDAEAPLLHALAIGVRSHRISRDEAVGIAVVMFGAGGESTSALIGSAVRRLAESPELADELRTNPGRIPLFVEEVARLEPPFKFHYRVVRRACELGGAELRPGDRLMLLWASANRDSKHIDDPDTLRLDRRHPKYHLSFGRGNHFCVGAPFARLEGRVVCEELLAHCARLELASGETPRYAASIFVRRLEHLPLVVAESGRRD